MNSGSSTMNSGELNDELRELNDELREFNKVVGAGINRDNGQGIQRRDAEDTEIK